MFYTKTKTKLFKGLIIVLIAGQLAFGFSFLFTPKPAKAIFGVGDVSFDTTVLNIWQLVKDIGLAIVQKLAINYANKYIQKFSDKIIDKYRIKDYLNYDKVLSGYYINQYVASKVSDPDLKAIYGILATDLNNRFRATNTSTYQSQPVLAALKQKLDLYYYNQGGIKTDFVYSPSGQTSEEAYFQSAQAYFSNPPSFTDSQVRGQFSQMFSDSQSAASSEISQSDGYKNSRSDAATSGTTAGSTTSIASIIQNPAGYIKSFADNAINSIFVNNLHTNGSSIGSTIGSLLGDFIFNKLNLNSTEGSVIEETDTSYSPNNQSTTNTVATIDLDNDGVPDGEDTNADGIIETCYHGENAPTGQSPPDCKKSTLLTPAEAQASPYYAQLCKVLDNAVDGLKAWYKFQIDHIDQTNHGATITWYGVPTISADFNNDADAEVWGEQGSKALSFVHQLLDVLKTKTAEGQNFDPSIRFINRHAVYLDTIVQSLFTDDDVDLGAGATNGDGGTFQALASRTRSILKYVTDMRTKVGRCDSPNLAALAAIVPPSDVGLPDTGGTPPEDADTAHPDQTDLVAQVKADLVAAGTSIVESCGAFEITKRVAWALSADGAGLMTRTSSENCNGIASDIIMYPDGYIYDILIDSGGANTPQWLAGAAVAPTLYVAPTDPAL